MDEKKLTITINKGKGKAKEEISPPPFPPIKKRVTYRIDYESDWNSLPYYLAKRAETRPCPVCDEPIPLRLMALHAQLESERLEEIIKQIGSSEPILLADELHDLRLVSFPPLVIGSLF